MVRLTLAALLALGWAAPAQAACISYRYYRDADGDGYGNSASYRDACSPPSGYVSNSTDCDDTNSAMYPGNAEVCDGYDNDCNGITDDAGGRLWYRDADSDGWGDAGTTTFGCTTPSGYVGIMGDCNDANPAVNSGATEVCNGIDDDCDSSVDEEGGTVFYFDGDGDGYGISSRTYTGCTAPANYVSNSTDCNDGSSAVHPGATEVCNSVDDDCDGTVDDGAGTTYFADSDRDGYGNPSSTMTACSLPTGYVTNNSDCNDTNASVHPGTTETCNSIDDDCDGSIDNGIGATWYRDADSDTYGDSTVSTRNCTRPTGYTSDATDCDDTVNSTYPGATEWCNGVDDDCDGIVDDSAYDVSTWYEDADGDGYGNELVTTASCDAPTGYTGPTGDCWDDDATVNPGATETADGVDDDCDGVVDEGTDWYDDDGDGFTEDGGDCNDAKFDVNPAMTEGCDGEDDNCDGVIDDGTRCYDDDGDGYTEDDLDCNDQDGDVYPGAPEDPYNGVDDDCDGTVDAGRADPDGDGYTNTGGDCNEGVNTVHPGAEETINGVDDDCDGVVDEGTDAYDDDADGYSEDDGDCNDYSRDTYPEADEVEDGVDNNCNGMVDEGGDTTDDDGDGYSEAEGDCDDTVEFIGPTAEETLNNLDDDCDGQTDEGLVDSDADGFTTEDGDCDDNEGWAFPGGKELCDEIDNDCNGVVDDGCDGTDTGVKDPGKCGCAADATVPALLPLALGFAMAIRRRRR